MEDTSATEQVLQIISDCMSELRKSIEEIRQVVVPEHLREHTEPVHSIVNTAALYDLNNIEGRDLGLESQTRSFGAPESSALQLAPDTLENETTTRESVLSSAHRFSDLAGSGAEVVGDNGRPSEDDGVPLPLHDICKYLPSNI